MVVVWIGISAIESVAVIVEGNVIVADAMVTRVLRAVTHVQVGLERMVVATNIVIAVVVNHDIDIIILWIKNGKMLLIMATKARFISAFY